MGDMCEVGDIADEWMAKAVMHIDLRVSLIGIKRG